MSETTPPVVEQIATLPLDSIFDAVKFAAASDRTLILQACVQEKLAQIGSIEQKLGQQMQALRQEWSNLSYSLSKNAAPAAALASYVSKMETSLKESLAELAASHSDLSELADGANLDALFRGTAAGKRLLFAWKALVDGDTETLATLTGYAPNDLGSEQVAYSLFRNRLAEAGIGMTSDGWGGGGSSGERHGSLTFSLGETGLRVAYDHVFDYGAKLDDKKYSAAVVKGSISENGWKFNMVGEPNADAEAVKALAEAISAKLKEHYLK